MGEELGLERILGEDGFIGSTSLLLLWPFILDQWNSLRDNSLRFSFLREGRMVAAA